jgi:hypothetical protein
MDAAIISQNTIIEREEEIIGSEVDDEVILMSIDNEKYYGLDDIGSSIWKKIEKPASVSEIVDALLKEYLVDEITCTKEVIKFLQEMELKRVIRIKN